ncbi:hypothetical protein H2203_000924 [Taxawa tesnikishii (nom. ined.)]|nr:hypothetical protein H2203_000924 [Dothideales sp. JES 119]
MSTSYSTSVSSGVSTSTFSGTTTIPVTVTDYSTSVGSATVTTVASSPSASVTRYVSKAKYTTTVTGSSKRCSTTDGGYGSGGW